MSITTSEERGAMSLRAVDCTATARYLESGDHASGVAVPVATFRKLATGAPDAE